MYSRTSKLRVERDLVPDPETLHFEHFFGQLSFNLKYTKKKKKKKKKKAR